MRSAHVIDESAWRQHVYFGPPVMVRSDARVVDVAVRQRDRQSRKHGTLVDDGDRTVIMSPFGQDDGVMVEAGTVKGNIR